MKNKFERKLFALLIGVIMLFGNCMTVFAESAEAAVPQSTSTASLILAVVTAFIITLLVSRKRTNKREKKRNAQKED